MEGTDNLVVIDAGCILRRLVQRIVARQIVPVALQHRHLVSALIQLCRDGQAKDAGCGGEVRGMRPAFASGQLVGVGRGRRRNTRTAYDYHTLSIACDVRVIGLVQRRRRAHLAPSRSPWRCTVQRNRRLVLTTRACSPFASGGDAVPWAVVVVRIVPCGKQGSGT